MTMIKDNYRIENIQIIKLNGRTVKSFKAYKLDPPTNSYHYYGTFTAPPHCQKNLLYNYIEDDIMED